MQIPGFHTIFLPLPHTSFSELWQSVSLQEEEKRSCMTAKRPAVCVGNSLSGVLPTLKEGWQTGHQYSETAPNANTRRNQLLFLCSFLRDKGRREI